MSPALELSWSFFLRLNIFLKEWPFTSSFRALFPLFPKAPTSLPLYRYLWLPDVLNTRILLNLQKQIFQQRQGQLSLRLLSGQCRYFLYHVNWIQLSSSSVPCESAWLGLLLSAGSLKTGILSNASLERLWCAWTLSLATYSFKISSAFRGFINETLYALS